MGVDVMAHAYIAKSIKHLNRKYVFDIIRKQRGVTRSEVGRVTGISAPTMLKIFEYFVGMGILREVGELDSPIGRRANLFVFNPNSYYAIGVDYSGETISIGLVNLDNKIVKMAQYDLHCSFLESFDVKLSEYISKFILTCEVDIDKLLGVGIGCPTTIGENNIIPFAPLVGITVPIDMTVRLKTLEKKVGLSVFLENDTNAASKGEYENQHLSEDSSIVFLSLKRGLGAGFVMNGKLWRGARNIAGEIGYLVFDDSYRTDVTKPGWMEEQFINSIISTNNLSTTDILQICAEADEKQKEIIINNLTGYIALTIANISAVLNIDYFIIGGEITKSLGTQFISKVKDKVKKLAVSKLTIKEETCSNPVIAGMGAIVCEINSKNIIG